MVYAFVDSIVNPLVFGLEPCSCCSSWSSSAAAGAMPAPSIGATVLFLCPILLAPSSAGATCLVYGLLVVLALICSSPTGLIGLYDTELRPSAAAIARAA